VFLTFVAAVITAVDRHVDKLCASAANPGNDLRLGANEAPPAIISIFMGSALSEILNCIAQGKKYQSKGQQFINIGADVLPPLPKDNTDRNRTSPFAFTGNKFEFRMVPSSTSIAGPNTVLNTIVAEALDEIAGRLEKAKDINSEVTAIVKEAVQKHGRVIFDGNGYTEEWVAEAAKRGLPNIKSSVEAYKAMATKEAVELFEKYKVLSERELHSRYEIYLEQYAKHINIEGRCAVNMAKTQYFPAIASFQGELADIVTSVKTAGGDASVAADHLSKVTGLFNSAVKKLAALEAALDKANGTENMEQKAAAFRDLVFTAQADLRKDVDALEQILPADLWPVPTYAEMLFQSSL
jgi:glutamine synthetase